MPIGIALVLIFILYLIDKHDQWRRALKIFAGLIVLGILLTCGWFGWKAFDAYRIEKLAEAEAAAFQSRVKDCLAKSTPAGNAVAAKEHEAWCEENPDSPLIIDFSTSVPISPVPTEAKPRTRGQYTAADIDQPQVQAVVPIPMQLKAVTNGQVPPDSTSLFSGGPSAWSITLNVIGGILTIGVSWLFRLGLQRWYRHRFKRIFGRGEEPYVLVHARLKPPEKEDGSKFVFTKEGETGFEFKAENVASNCEVRAASYLASALGKDGHRFSVFADDKSVKETLDMDFISFGALSNDKTIDLFNNPANNLATFDPNKMAFVSKENGQPLRKFRPDRDYGIIIKIHPTQFPKRTWIACAGLGETGTSGSAWFLAHEWKRLEKKFRGNDQFVAVIEVEKDKDQSAIPI